MKTRYINIFIALIFIFVNFSFPLHSEQVKWITSPEQVSSNYPGSDPDVISKIVDGNSESRYYSGSFDELTSAPYIQVDLRGNPITEDRGDMVVYTQRTTGGYWAGSRPTAFEVKGVFRDNNISGDIAETEWVNLCYVYLLFRGDGTHEYSTRVSLDRIFGDNKGKELVALRFTVTANNGRKYDRKNGFREMSMSEFQIYTLGADDNFPDGLKDRLHLLTDYQRDFYSYEFKHTKGIFDSENNIDGWSDISENDVAMLKENGIDFPDFDFITSSTSLYPLEEGEKRQPAHTVEHILYAVPGDAIALYPYYELPGSSNYQENFSHWYDWETGGRLKYPSQQGIDVDFDLLDFLVDPSEIQITENNGFFGSSQFPGINRTFKISTVEEFIFAAKMVNNGKDYVYIELESDLDFSGYDNVPTIGVEGSQFSGIFNGKGHTIRNLHISTDREGAGLIGQCAGDNVKVMNVIIDSSCTFYGPKSVGLVGLFGWGRLEITNVKTEATYRGTDNNGEHKAAGLLGTTQSNNSQVVIADCYVGGEIGDPEKGSNNAALIGWMGLTDNGAWCQITRTYVTANVNRPEEGKANLRFDGSNQNANNNYRVDNSYSRYNIQDFHSIPSGRPSEFNNWRKIWDGTKPDSFTDWIEDESGRIYPPMGAHSDRELETVEVNSVDDYLRVVRMVNNDGKRDLCISIKADLDFMGVTVDPVGKEGSEFTGVLNGNGHTLSNLVIEQPDIEGVGIIGRAGSGVEVMNLIIDSTCSFTGRNCVGIVGLLDGKEIRLNNIWSEASVIGEAENEDQRVASLLGTTKQQVNVMSITDCYLGGKIGNKNINRTNSAIIGWLETQYWPDPTYNIERVLMVSDVHNPNNGHENVMYYANSIRVSDCYSVYSSQGFEEVEGDLLPPVSDFSADWFGRWNMDRKIGTFATFFCPRNPYEEGGVQHSLPFKEGRNEFVIAADFSQKFDYGKHVSGNTITEPIIAFRHIFRIRDGKEFAEDFSGSVANNEEYVRRNQKIVSARAGVPFQIRFDSPVPVSGITRSKYYYKISEQDYRRVCSMRIKVLDADTRREIPKEEIEFYPGDTFQGQGVRKIDGISYSLCAGTDSYYRMLKCDSPKEGRYIVQLIGNDINGDPIHIFGSADKELVVMEYHISFLPESGASVVTEQQLYSKTDNRFKHAREEELVAKYGEAKSKVDFDEYCALEEIVDKKKFLDIDGGGHSYYKWPVEWNNSNYGFGYNNRHDYNMYMLANHCDRTPYHTAASAWTDNLKKDGSGLYDRLYYKTKRLHLENPEKYPEKTVRKGYFYYVNAATDPGVMSKLSIDELCPGSTIHVSAWMSEFTGAQPETANLSFNFVAVLKNKADRRNGEQDKRETLSYSERESRERVVLHSFVTGYVPRALGENGAEVEKVEGDPNDLRGEWLNVYYSFVPRLSEFSEEGVTSEDVHHYELELDNNCKSSAGADYAIDNIRIYLVKPVVYARQMTPVCDEEQQTTVKVEAPFDVLLQAMGEQEGVSDNKEDVINVYYTFLDKEKYDNSGLNGQERFESAVLKYQYDRNVENDAQTFGKLSFKLKYTDNPEYEDRGDGSYDLNCAFREIAEDGERMIIFNTEPSDKNLSVGKEYYVLLATTTGSSSEKDPESGSEDEFFDPENDCVKKCVFRVKSSSVVKIDGVVVEELDKLSVCSNQSPVVQVNIWGVNNMGEFEEVEKNAFFDWFDGSNSEYEEYEEDGVKLKDALTLFRESYPDLEVVAGAEATGKLTQEMIDLIERISTGKSSDDLNPKLILHQSSYVFPPVNVEDGKVQYCSVLAVPIIKEREGVLICAAPTELRIKVESKAPELLHGLNLEYPANLSDVPLRIGLSQLKSVSGNGSAEGNVLTIPVRKVATVGDNSNATGMQLKELKGADIVLVQTNDPEYRNIGTVDQYGNETGELLVVGEIASLTAVLGDNVSGNKFDAYFDSSFKFKEGYYYRMRFLFEEDNRVVAEPAADEDDPLVCDGQDVFTIKVVPEYQVWTGARNSNFNNDENWSRVRSDMIYREQDAQSEFMTDGVNSRIFSYAPLDFTKVIVPVADRLPYLYEPATESQNGYEKLPDDNNKVEWAASPSEFTPGDYADIPEEGVGEATYLIQYDMAAYAPKESTGKESTGILCRPWYHNTCAEIHFKSGSELMNQQTLRYQRAWVDLETRPGRWYTLSMPLQEVYAGDMYLPSANARQETELFQPINFDNSLALNHRFKPAVYQRGWNKGTATVYVLPGESGGSGGNRNVAVKVNWSHVYNDVEEVYGGGAGYSIKTDLSGVEKAEETVIFRLPKADETYMYFNQEGTISGNTTTINRSENHYKLNPGKGSIAVKSAGSSRYFLVGNPFMAHLDMQKFLEANSGVVSKKYWILTDDGQQAGIFDETTDGFIGSASGIVAPMQGFFVEASTESEELTLTYDETMMRRNGDGSTGNPKVGTRSENGGRFLTISSVNDGEISSTAVLSVEGGSDGGYLESEDMVALDHSDMEIASTVYTVSAGMALAVNRTNDAEGVEVGVISADDERTVLRFEGVDAVEGLSLYDKETGEMTELYDGMEYTVKGSVAHRLYLTGMSPETISTPIEWSLSGNEVTVYGSSVGATTSVNVYDTLGRIVVSICENSDEIRFTLEDGVYVMEVVSGDNRLKEKIRI